MLEQQKAKQAQRFGKAIKSYGDFGELRRQKKAPHLEVFYTPINEVVGNTVVEKLRSINNCSSDQITDAIRRIGMNLTGGNITQENAEFILDLLYQELGKRVTS